MAISHQMFSSMNSTITTTVIVDVDESITIDPQAVEDAIGPRTKAVVPVHMWGAACNMDAIMDIARRRNLITNFASVETPDDKTVVINMKSPQAPNPGAEIPIVPKHVWEKIKNPADYPNDKNLVGSGPFVLTDYKASQRINLTANKNFWRGEPKIGGLQYIYYTNSDAQVQALRAGDVDFATQLSTTQFDALQNAQNVTTHEGHNRRYFSISINVGMETRDGKPFGNGNPALQDVNVRQAIRQGIDKIGQLAKVVCADSDRLIGAFHLVEDQQPRGDAGALSDERAFDGASPKPTRSSMHPARAAVSITPAATGAPWRARCG